MKIELAIDNDPDKEIIKAVCQSCFDGDLNKTFLVGFITSKGTYNLYYKDDEGKLIKHIVKRYLEELNLEKGENGVFRTIDGILDEIDRGE